METEQEPETPVDQEERIAAAEGLERAVWEALQTVEDPELPVSIVDLGLVYDVSVAGRRAEIDVTVTYSGCPGRDMILDDVDAAVRGINGIDAVDSTVVYAPRWTVDRITARGRAALKEFGLAVPGASDRPDPDCHE